MPSRFSSKPLVYLETSFISYLTARVSSDEKTARWQVATRRWWEQIAPTCDLFVSDTVLREATKGDSEQVSRRMAVLSGIPVVESTDEVFRLAKRLLAAHAIPPDSTTDAVHVAAATVYKADVLLTWNCRHIANSTTLPITCRTLLEAGYDCPAIATPEQRLEELR